MVVKMKKNNKMNKGDNVFVLNKEGNLIKVIVEDINTAVNVSYGKKNI